MLDAEKQLGKLVTVHTLAPEHVQRAVFIAVLSFVFFLAMMVMFYIRENVLYFLLASAFLVVYVITLLSWIVQRRSVVKVFQNGISFKKQAALWDEISGVDDTGTVTLRNQKTILLPRSLNDLDGVVGLIRHKIRKEFERGSGGLDGSNGSEFD